VSNVSPIVSRQETKPKAPSNTQYWDRREGKEKVLLRMSMNENIIMYIRDCKTSKKTWDTLRGLYETTNKNRVLFLKSKVLSIKMEENENVNNFISRIKKLKDKLSDIGENISNMDLVTVTSNDMLEGY